jgi:hypothetical protein
MKHSFLLLLLALFAFAACNGSQSEIVGKWKPAGEVGEVIWEFKENGSISIGGKLGKYSLGDGNRIKIQTQTATFVNQLAIEGDRMTWKAPDGSKQEFTRVK